MFLVEYRGITYADVEHAGREQRGRVLGEASKPGCNDGLLEGEPTAGPVPVTVYAFRGADPSEAIWYGGRRLEPAPQYDE